MTCDMQSIANVPPGIDTISGISCVAIGAVAGVGDELSLGLSSSTCAGTGTDGLPFSFSAGAGAAAGNGFGVLAVTAGDSGVPGAVGAGLAICFCRIQRYQPPRLAITPVSRRKAAPRADASFLPVLGPPDPAARDRHLLDQ
jgi:hypothetical protein